MKNKFMFVLITTVFLVVGGWSTSLYAQKSLEKWLDKCGKEDGVNYSLISRKDKNTKEILSNMVSISFNINEEPFLYEELLEGVKADKKDAIEIIESKKGGELRPEVYKFYDSFKKEYTTYIFSIDKKTISVVVTTSREGGVTTSLGGGGKTLPLKGKLNQLDK